MFQKGWGESLLGFKSTGAVTGWLPLFMFVVLFGLSMDYHVFILSRVREAYDGGMSTADAVSHGIKSTAGVVTSAAVVMVTVFGAFVMQSSIDMKQMGFGLAAAVLIDATIIRGVLLPGSMRLLGEWNWWLPKRLGFLPKIAHEPEVMRAGLITQPHPTRRPPIGGRRSFPYPLTTDPPLGWSTWPVMNEESSLARKT